MCEKVDLGQKACCTSAKIMLFVIGGGELLIGIVLAILAGVAGSRNSSGWFVASAYLTMGIITIVLCFYSAKWFLILNYVGQILLAIDAVVVSVVLGLFLGTLAVASELGAKAKGDQETFVTCMYVLISFSILGCVFSIMAGVLYAKILCCGGGGGSRSSSFSSGTS